MFEIQMLRNLHNIGNVDTTASKLFGLALSNAVFIIFEKRVVKFICVTGLVTLLALIFSTMFRFTIVHVLGSLVSAVLIFLLTLPLYLFMKIPLLHKLSRSAVVWYNILASLLNQSLYVLHVGSHRGLSNFVALIITCFVHFAAYNVFILSDSLPKTISRVVCRYFSPLIFLYEVYNSLNRRLNSEWFRQNWSIKSFTETVHGSGVEHEVFSTLDLQNSCSAVLIVVAAKVAIYSIRFPESAVVLKENLLLTELLDNVDDERSGQTTFLTKFASSTLATKFQVFVDQWAPHYGVVMGILHLAQALVFHSNHEDSLSYQVLAALSSVVFLIFSISVFLCLRIRILQKLFKRLQIWYFISFLIIARVIDNVGCLGAKCGWPFWFHGHAILFSLMVVPFVDALPSGRASKVLTRFLLPFTAITSLLFWTTAHQRGINDWISTRQGLPAVLIEPLDQTFFNIWAKAYLLIAFLATSMSYRAWRFPELAVLLDKRVPSAVIHETANVAHRRSARLQAAQEAV